MAVAEAAGVGHNTGGVFLEFIEAYRDNRVAFVRQVLGLSPVEWQREALAALDRGETRMSIRSGHGVGKSSFLAWVMLHYLLTRWPVKVVCTAPSANQLFDALFAELKSTLLRLPESLRLLVEAGADRIYLKSDPTCFISARTSRAEQPEALQGIHALYTMLVVDEASGVVDPIFEAADGSMSTPGAIAILTGNPTRTGNYFWNTQTRWAHDWWTRKVGCFDSPLVSMQYIEDTARKYGRDSNQYRIRVLGEFPTSDEDTFIPRHLVESALGRDIQDDASAIYWGLDVARGGAAMSALAKRQGRVVYEPVKTWNAEDAMNTVATVKLEWDVTPKDRRPVYVFVDAIGIGGPVADRLFELGIPSVGVNVSEAVSMQGAIYHRLRDELYGNVRTWLESRKVSLPREDDLLVEELVAPFMKHHKTSGKIVLESKMEMRARGLRSPDRADALALTFAYEGASASGIMPNTWASKARNDEPKWWV